MRLQLAFVLLGDSAARYFLQWNSHLRSYNFFGGHVEVGESDRAAALRELAEELGVCLPGRAECEARYGLQLPEAPELAAQLALACGRVADEPIAQVQALPFYSLRYSAPVTRDVQLFGLELRSGAPNDGLLMERLRQMQGFVPSARYWSALNMPAGGVPLVKAFSVAELAGLADAGSGQAHNPFVAWALASGVLAST